MKLLVSSKINLLLLGFAAVLLIAAGSQPTICFGSDGVAPVADAGSSRYAAQDPVVLDGTSSYDPDSSGPLSYEWRQIAGPSVVITDANTATPTISGFTQTSDIQECGFELVVSDGVLTSLPDTVKIIIVPSFGPSTLRHENPPFNPDKPTVIYFGGGNCVTGGGSWGSTAWAEKANIISFPSYGPDSGGGARTYYKYGDMIIVYLSAVAPDYNQPIQTMGWSTGGQPAVDVGIHMNLTYADTRYAINRVTFLDAISFCRSYSESISAFLTSSVDGEQCWVDSYAVATFLPNILNVLCPSMSHGGPPAWYKASLMNADMNEFNNGVIGGAYWSVIGLGKNLQLASTPGTLTYIFEWQGGSSSGYMDSYAETSYPGRLPEPVTLLEPNFVGEDGGFILTCEESENAVGYQLLFGPDPYRVMDYNIISDTPAPPNDVITTFPLEGAWWTVRVRDQYGSTIYADPIYINPALDLVDFDRNRNVDFKDFSILAQYWDQNEPSVDIAPPPSGDGIVDFKDVAIFSEYWLAYSTLAQASNPNPADGATGVSTTADLSWTAGSRAPSHDVYFGTTNPPPFIGNQTATTFDPGTMTISTMYFWRIDEVNAQGKTIGTVWHFTTESGPPPP